MITELTWKESGVTVCQTLKACRIALWVSFSPTLGVKLDMLQEGKKTEHQLVREQDHRGQRPNVGWSNSFRNLLTLEPDCSRQFESPVPKYQQPKYS